MIPGEALILLALLLFAVFRDEPEWLRERERDEIERLHEAWEDEDVFEPQEAES